LYSTCTFVCSFLQSPSSHYQTKQQLICTPAIFKQPLHIIVDLLRKFSLKTSNVFIVVDCILLVSIFLCDLSQAKILYFVSNSPNRHSLFIW
jgi:hypothetical protein